MIKKMIFLSICLVVNCTIFGNEISSSYVVAKDSGDMTVNLRNSDNLQSKVLAKIPNGTPMSCSVDQSSNPKFCFVKLDENQRRNYGFIYMDKLSGLDHDSSFKKIPLVKSDLRSATYKNNHVSVSVRIVSSGLNKKNFSRKLYQGVDRLFYKNERVYGTDGEIVDSTFLYSAIEINQNENKYTIPVSQFQGLFIPSYFVENNLVFDHISIYYNPKENKMYVFSTQADGAALYTVVFELKNNRLVKKNVWLESS